MSIHWPARIRAYSRGLIAAGITTVALGFSGWSLMGVKADYWTERFEQARFGREEATAWVMVEDALYKTARLPLEEQVGAIRRTLNDFSAYLARRHTWDGISYTGYQEALDNLEALIHRTEADGLFTEADAALVRRAAVGAYDAAWSDLIGGLKWYAAKRKIAGMLESVYLGLMGLGAGLIVGGSIGRSLSQREE